MIKVLTYPTSENPYQKLLYGKYENEELLKITYLNGIKYRFHSFSLMLLVPFKILYYRLMGYKIFHLHWIAFNFPSNSTFFRFISFFYTLLNIYLIKLLGYKLVWTVHNILPHTEYTINDFQIGKYLFYIADLKIVHSKYNINIIKKNGFDADRIVIIPHGSYVNTYPNTITQGQARDELNIKMNQHVFLFFGMIKAYKGIENLLNAFTLLNEKEKEIILLIAGQVHDKEIDKKIRIYKAKYKNIIYHAGYIKDKDIQKYMNASNVVVYPFNKITTSGSTLLALSFKKPIIYPLLGSLIDMPVGLGYSYNHKDAKGLYKAMSISIKKSGNLTKIDKNILNYLETLSWDNISNKTYIEYIKLAENKW